MRNTHVVWIGSTVLLLVSDVCIIHFQTVVSVLFSYEITFFTEKTIKYNLHDDKIKGSVPLHFVNMRDRVFYRMRRIYRIAG